METEHLVGEAFDEVQLKARLDEAGFDRVLSIQSNFVIDLDSLAKRQAECAGEVKCGCGDLAGDCDNPSHNMLPNDTSLLGGRDFPIRQRFRNSMYVR
jgi:hypothetical protein